MMMLRIKDNSRNNKSDFSCIGNIAKKVADKSFEQLEQEGVLIFPPVVKDFEDITKDQMVLQSVNDCYCSSNVMGFIGYGNERLVIESRFCKQNNDYFLQYLLSKVLNLPDIVNLQTDTAQSNRLFNLLEFLFPFYLQNATRKGIFKAYIRHEYNDANVKGAIDIARHIKSNTPFVGKISYNRREYSYDNYLTELVRHTVEFIKKKPYGNNLLAKIKNEVKIVVDATPDFILNDRLKVVLKNKENPIRHAFYREYRALQHLCVLILQYQKHQIGSGIRQIYGILFDGAWLWEEYINTLVKEYFYHPMNKSGKGAQRLFNDNKGLIYPDFIGREQTNRIIADAKYKPINNIGKGGDDYLQILAYMMRFSSKKGYFFYPEIEETNYERYWLNTGCTYENNVAQRDDVCVIKCGLKIPKNADTYNEFASSMKENEEKFMKLLDVTTDKTKNYDTKK